jgi:hypothetical protein
MTFQDCGCIALPDEVVTGLGSSGRTVLELSCDHRSRTFSMTSPLPVEGAAAMRAGVACLVGIGAK